MSLDVPYVLRRPVPLTLYVVLYGRLFTLPAAILPVEAAPHLEQLPLAGKGLAKGDFVFRAHAHMCSSKD